VAPTWVTPYAGRADMLRVIDAETFLEPGRRSPYRALLYAAVAALAVCAGVGPDGACLFLLDDYKADKLQAKSIDRNTYPVILLPLVIALIEDYLEERRKRGIGGVHLFVNEKGKPFKPDALHAVFTGLFKRAGHRGARTFGRLIEFFDAQLEKEPQRERGSDECACVVLRRGRRGRMGFAKADIDAAKADRARLATVLARNHELAGPPGAWTGSRGRAISRQEARLFTPPRRGRKLSPGALADKVCMDIAGRDWVGKETVLEEQRKEILDEHMRHLYDLLKRKKLITLADLRHLLHCGWGTADKIVRQYRDSIETAVERQAREQRDAQWRDRMIALYRERPRGEEPFAFYERVVASEDVPFKWAKLMVTLQKAFLLPKQVRRRQKQARRRKRDGQTREEYLANSPAAKAPWIEAGVSRRTWERRKKGVASVVGIK
jgi:hypothetical protein